MLTGWWCADGVQEQERIYFRVFGYEAEAAAGLVGKKLYSRRQ